MELRITLTFGLLCLIIEDQFDEVIGQQTECACYGNDATIDSIMPNCTASNGIIAIDSVYRAAKLQSTGCPNPATAGTRDEANCCTYDSSNDCRIDLTSADIPTVYSDCSGAGTCSKQVTWQGTTADCSGSHMSQTNYMCMDYYCFSTSDALEFCDTSGTQVLTTTSYFYNDGYPSSISHFNCCACVITASAASATIDLDLLDLQLYDETSTCLQTVFVTDSAGVVTYNCTENNDYTIRTLLTSTGNSLTVTLKSDASAAGNGKAWFRATVSNGGMTTSCSSVTQCPDETTTTTSTTSTSDNSASANAASGTSSDNAKKETWLFGLSVTISAILLAALSLFILITCLICCAVCYKWGKSKSFDVTQSRSESRQHLNTDRSDGSPDSLSVYTSSIGDKTINTGIQSVRSSDLDLYSHHHSLGPRSEVSTRTGMFVYKPFENRNHLINYFRRPSLVRIESP